ncbi:MAG: cyclopropane-fatty-acyl-phospholipid synthase family protein [Acidimicrobiales bacterium]
MTSPPATADALARAAVLRVGRRMDHGTIVLHETSTPILLGRGEPVVAVTIADPRAYRALLRGSPALADAYVRGWWTSDDLTGLFRLLHRNLAGFFGVIERVATAARPLLDPPARLRRRDKQADRRNIRTHYDIGNDFYALMLDSTMTYSCAVFDRPGMTLADAQTAKLDRLCRLLDLSPTDHLVEIGTGWGGLATHAAAAYGCRVTTTTISDAQHDYATKRVAEAGLADRVTVLDADYRDLDGTYDKLVSVEMIEAVDWRDHDAYFAACAGLVREGGRAAFQAILINERSFERTKRHDDFIRRTIFPGGCLPSLQSINTASSRAGLRLLELHDIGEHYPETLRAWRANLAGHEAEVTELGLGQDFRRLWDFYLTYCGAAFLEHHVSDVQMLFAR